MRLSGSSLVLAIDDCLTKLSQRVSAWSMRILWKKGLGRHGEQFADPLKAIFGILIGGGDARKRFVEDGNNTALLPDFRSADEKSFCLRKVDCLMHGATGKPKQVVAFGN